MKSFVRVCVHRKSSESRRSIIVVYSPWNLEFEVDQDKYLNTCIAMKDSKPTLLYELLNVIFNLSE